MLISEIKCPEIRARAENNKKTLPSPEYSRDRNELTDAFHWAESPEGLHFWNSVDDGRIVDMPKNILIEIKMPVLGIGWRYTGEYRVPVCGVDYIYINGQVVMSRGQRQEYPIVEFVG